jgi:hypothetical protein
VNGYRECDFCGKPATCYGQYEGVEEAEDGSPDYGCDDCCGHGNEDGWCKPLSGPQETKGGSE